jgi:two-component system chemotaxis response regulator CheY
MALDPSMPVLVVDDYSTMVRIIRNLLRQVGFSDVDDANDGAAALAKMRAKRYGLVISDWKWSR